MFALFYHAESRTVKAINGSGRCPRALTAARVRADLNVPEAGIPREGVAGFPLSAAAHIHTVTVPGTAAGWADTVEEVRCSIRNRTRHCLAIFALLCGLLDLFVARAGTA